MKGFFKFGNPIIELSIEGRKAFYNIASKEEIIKLLITYRASFFDAMVDRVAEMWELG